MELSSQTRGISYILCLAQPGFYLVFFTVSGKLEGGTLLAVMGAR